MGLYPGLIQHWVLNPIVKPRPNRQASEWIRRDQGPYYSNVEMKAAAETSGAQTWLHLGLVNKNSRMF